jgi:hypothetical protein
MHDCMIWFFDRTETFTLLIFGKDWMDVSKIVPGNRVKVGFFPESPAPSAIDFGLLQKA